MNTARNFCKWADKNVERFIPSTRYVPGTTYSMSWRYSNDQDRQVLCPHGAYILEGIIRIRTHANLKSKLSAVYNIIPCGDIKTLNKIRGRRQRMQGFRRIVRTRRGGAESWAGILRGGRHKAERGERKLRIPGITSLEIFLRLRQWRDNYL